MRVKVVFKSGRKEELSKIKSVINGCNTIGLKFNDDRSVSLNKEVLKEITITPKVVPTVTITTPCIREYYSTELGKTLYDVVTWCPDSGFMVRTYNSVKEANKDLEKFRGEFE